MADDASTDGSAAAVRRAFPKAHVVEAPERLGAAGIRNVGIRFAQDRFEFDYLLFLDNDAFVEPSTLARLLDAGGESAVRFAEADRRVLRLHHARTA